MHIPVDHRAINIKLKAESEFPGKNYQLSSKLSYIACTGPKYNLLVHPHHRCKHLNRGRVDYSKATTNVATKADQNHNFGINISSLLETCNFRLFFPTIIKNGEVGSGDEFNIHLRWCCVLLKINVKRFSTIVTWSSLWGWVPEMGLRKVCKSRPPELCYLTPISTGCHQSKAFCHPSIPIICFLKYN